MSKYLNITSGKLIESEDENTIKEDEKAIIEYNESE